MISHFVVFASLLASLRAESFVLPSNQHAALMHVYESMGETKFFLSQQLTQLAQVALLRNAADLLPPILVLSTSTTFDALKQA